MNRDIRRSVVQATVILLLGICGTTGRSQEKPVAIPAASIDTKVNDDGVLFLENGLPVLQYQATPKSIAGEFKRANYVHPLYDLNGTVVTEDFPADHLHQRGIFWAWHQVKVGKRAAGDSWMADQFEWDVTATNVKSLPGGAAQLTTLVSWRSPAITNEHGYPLTIVNESTRITLHPTANKRRLIDFQISLTAALPDVTIAGSDDAKGYGGFSARILQPKDISFLTTNGVVQPIREAAEFGNWVDVTGTFGSTKAQNGTAIFVHPSSTGFPQKWILRSDIKSMQNPVFPGRHSVAISQTQPTVLRYRIMMHQNLLTIAELNRVYNNYASLEFPEPKSTPELGNERKKSVEGHDK